MTPNELTLTEAPEQAVATAKAMTVVDQLTYDEAGYCLKDIRGLQDAVAKSYDPVIKAASDSHKMALKQKAEKWSPLEDAAKWLMKQRTDWKDAQDAAKKKADDEAAAKAWKDREAQEATAKALEAAGQPAVALEVRKAAVLAPVAAKASTPAPQKTEGVATRITYHAEVSDKAALIKAVAASGLDVMDYLTANMPRLNELARNLRREGELFPGVVGVKDATEQVRRY